MSLRFLPRAAFAVCACLLSVAALSAQSSAATPAPKFVSQNGRHMLLVDGQPYLLLGVQMHNSSNWPSLSSKVWRAYEQMSANTLEAPIYWEQFEPQPGQFDYSAVDRLLEQAREHRARLVLLWFGTWKNGSGHYWPEWMKLDEARYPHALGADGRRIDSPSPFAEATLAADVRAFSALCSHLKAVDPQHTVIMLQVENEAGMWGSARDHSPAAERLFAAPAPLAVLKAMGKADRAGRSWAEVFGEDADEYFEAWATARYIEQTAAAGKKILDIPFYVNAALRDPFHPGRPPKYESGGPTDNVIDLYKAVAPSIDVIAPDIYQPERANYLKTFENYRRADNPLFIPETSNRPEYSRYFFDAMGAQAVGFSPFGMDYTGDANPPLGAEVDSQLVEGFALNYRLTAPFARELARWSFEGRVHGFSEETERHQQEATIAGWRFKLSYGLGQYGPTANAPGNKTPIGRAMVVELGQNEFLVVGAFARVEIEPAAEGRHTTYLKIEQGRYEDGRFVVERILNGDQSDFGFNLGEGRVTRVRLTSY